MLHARGQRLTFCTDHIHHYYHHCFSSNRAEHRIPMRPVKMGEWTAIWLEKGEEGEEEEEEEEGGYQRKGGGVVAL